MTPTATKIRLGTASPATQATTEETLSLLSRLARRAVSQKVDILLLPEAFLGGYPRGATFGCAVGSRTEEGREEFRRYFRGALDLGDGIGEGGAGDGERWLRRGREGGREGKDGVEAEGVSGRSGDGSREKLEGIARETGVFLVVGCIERAGGSLYCTVVYVCPKLGVVGKRRKVMPTGTERLVWAQGSPATLRAVSTTIRGVRVNMAAAICWESYMPLLRQALYAQNVNLYLAPTADGRDAWLALMRTVAVEGRCFVVSSNMCVKAGGSRPVGPITQQQQQQHHQHQQHYQQPPLSPISGRRRNSLFTEDGFEIALPSPVAAVGCPAVGGGRAGTGGSRSPHRRRGSRRKSVMDEDGNEIVLCGGGGGGGGDDAIDEAVEDGDGQGKKDQDVEGAGPRAPNGTDAADVALPAAAAAASKVTSMAAAKGGEFISRGGSSIVGPFGDVLAGPQWEDDEALLVADVDFEDCIRGRLDLDAAGSYSRNDSFKFSVEGLDLSPLPY